MRAGIIGLPQSGRKTIFKAITKLRGETELDLSSQTSPVVVTITIYDPRIEVLKKIFGSKKKVFLKMEYLLPAEFSSSAKGEKPIWSQVRTCDELILVLRNFELAGQKPDPESDFWKVEEEMILNDLMVIEKRIEKISSDRRKGKIERDLEKERELLEQCKEVLEEGRPLREKKELISDPMLKGFTFLSAKPLLVVVNNEEDIVSVPKWKKEPIAAKTIAVRGKLEMELSEMDAKEAEEFRSLYELKESGIDLLIKESFNSLNKITFFTAGDKEARAWAVEKGTKAIDAAGEIHSDMKKGFISAEVISFEELKQCGSISEARKRGLLRVEGKDYVVQDGDVITFRFNV